MARVVKNVPIEFRRDSLQRLRQDWQNFAGVINEFLLGNWSTAAEGFRATSQLFLQRRRVYLSALCLCWCAKSHLAEGNEDQAVEASAEAVCRFISVGAYEYALDCLELFGSVNYKPITNEKLAKAIHQIAVTAYYFSDLDRMNRALSFASEPQRTKWLPVLNRFCAIAAEFSMENIVKRFNDTAASDGSLGIGDRLLEKSTKAMVEISHLTRELHSVGFVPLHAWPIRLACEHGNNLAASNLEAALAWSQTLNWNVAPKIALVFELTVLESLSWKLTLGYMSQQGAAVKTLIERSREIAYQTGKLDRYLLVLSNVRFLFHGSKLRAQCLFESSLIRSGIETDFDWETGIEPANVHFTSFDDLSRKMKATLTELDRQNTLLKRVKNNSLTKSEKLKTLSLVSDSIKQINRRELVSRLAYVELWKALLKSESGRRRAFKLVANLLMKAGLYQLQDGNYFGAAHFSALAYNSEVTLSQGKQSRHYDTEAILSEVAGYELLLDAAENRASYDMAHIIGHEAYYNHDESFKTLKAAVFFVFSEQERKGGLRLWANTRISAHIELLGDDLAGNLRHLLLARNLMNDVENPLGRIFSAAANVHLAAIADSSENVDKYLTLAIQDYSSWATISPHHKRVSELIEVTSAVLKTLRNPKDSKARKPLKALLQKLRADREGTSFSKTLQDIVDLLSLMPQLNTPTQYRTVGRLLRAAVDSVLRDVSASPSSFVDRPLKRIIRDQVQDAFFISASESDWTTAYEEPSQVDITFEVLSSSIESFSKYFLLHGQAFAAKKGSPEKELQQLLLLWLQARLPVSLISLREVEVGKGRSDLLIVSGRTLLPIEVKVTEGNYKTRKMINQLGEYLRSTDVEAGIIVVFERGTALSDSHLKSLDVEYEGRRVRIYKIAIGEIPTKKVHVSIDAKLGKKATTSYRKTVPTSQ